MLQATTPREKLRQARRALRRQQARAIAATGLPRGIPMLIYAARETNGVFDFQPLTEAEGQSPASVQTSALNPPWKAVAALKHRGGWAVAIQRSDDSNKFLAWHLDHEGARLKIPHYDAEEVLGWLDSIAYTISRDSNLIAECDDTIFDAKYAVFQALTSDSHLKKVISANISVSITARGSHATDLADTPALIFAQKLATHSGAINAEYLLDAEGTLSGKHILSFAYGASVVPVYSGGEPTLLLAKGRDMRLRASYVPSHRHLFGDASEWAGKEGSLLELFARQAIGLVTFARDVKRFVSQPIASYGLQTFEYHIGHYIWNELSALDALSTPNPPVPITSIYISKAQPEHFGAIEKLYPAWGNAIQNGAEPRDWLKKAFRNQQATLKPASRSISASLSRRILEVALDEQQAFTSNLDAVANKLSGGGRSDVLKLMIGLRVENRCWPQQVDGYVELAKLLSEQGRKVVFVFDGHNVGGRHQPILSATEGLKVGDGDLEAQSINAEREIVSTFWNSVHDLGVSISCIDTIGLPVAASLAAGHWCDGFISHWGAGLAKYKWILNSPGLIFTSNDARAKGDFLIYDMPTVREGAISSAYLDQAIIEDTDGAQSALMNGRQWTGNFTIDPVLFAKHCAKWIDKELRISDDRVPYLRNIVDTFNNRARR